MVGVQRGGRGKVKFEREARSLGSGREQIPTIALEFYFPLPPLCTSATQGNNGVVGLTSFQNKEMTVIRSGHKKVVVITGYRMAGFYCI